ncbi:MAG: hypothetical protein U0174_25795 [Polyangiaceae bacterium]
MKRPTAFTVYVILVVITAWFSASFFNLDEHYMTLQFAAVKLGRIPASEAPIEYGFQMRPWLQPGLYTVLLRGMEGVGLRNPFFQVTLLRLGHGVLTIFALRALMRRYTPCGAVETEGRNVDGEGVRDWKRRGVWLYAFLPYLSVRTSAENLSANLLAFALLVSEDALVNRNRRGRAAGLSLLGGFLFGLAFEVRYQLVFAIAGYLASLALRRAKGALSLVPFAGAGGVLAVAVGALVDHWGYGTWTPPIIAYFRKNMVEGMADSFGKEPFFAYLYLPLANICLPAAVACMAGAVAFCAKERRHPMTWVMVTFFVGHSAISHKEERFVFPVLLFAVVASAISFERWRSSPVFLRARRFVFPVYAVVNGFALVLLALLPLNWRGTIRVYKALYGDVYAREAHEPTRVIRVMDATVGAWQTGFYLPAKWERVKADAKLTCSSSERTYLLVDETRGGAPETPAGCTIEPLMSDLDAYAPVASRARMLWFARTTARFDFLPHTEWHTLYRLVPRAR